LADSIYILTLKNFLPFGIIVVFHFKAMDTPQRICKLHQTWVKTDHENFRHLL